MRKKPLSETNPFLKDPEKRKAGLITFVTSSSAIEGIRVMLATKTDIEEKTKNVSSVYTSSKSGKSPR